MRALLVALALVACKDKAPPPPAPSPPPSVADAAVAPRTMAVTVDRRVELVSIICRLAGFEEYTASTGTPYLAAVDHWFAPYAEHRAVVLARGLRAKNGIAYDAPMVFAVHLTDALALDNGDELAVIDRRWKGVDAAAFADAAKAFADEARLDAFRAEQAPYHASLEKALSDVIAKENPVAWFDSMFGATDATFTAIPSPIAGTRNFGPHATGTDGRRHFYQILGAMGPDVVELLVHEMAHSYINPVFAKHRAALEPSGANIYALVDAQMRAQAYATPATMLDESGVRAVVVNYMRAKHGDVAAARTARMEQRRSFLWINELAEVFRQFAKKGTRDLDAYMPQIVAFFDQLAASYANGLPLMPFRGPVDAVHQRAPVWVVPASAAVAGYARMIHTQLKKTGAIVTASETTLKEQRGKDLVVYGTPADNPVIAFVLRNAHWTLTKDSIVLGDKTFTGPGLVLIACWYLRDSPSNGAALYASGDAANLVGINSLSHGANDWLVARKQGAAFVILGAGDFARGLDDAWLLPGQK